MPRHKHKPPGEPVPDKEVINLKKKYKKLKERLVVVSKAGGSITCFRGVGLPGSQEEKPTTVKIGPSTNDITTARLAYLCKNEVYPAKKKRVTSTCGDGNCCRPGHMVSESSSKGRERPKCPGWIESAKHPGILFDACCHTPKCIKITNLERLATVKRSGEIDKPVKSEPKWAKGIEAQVDETGFKDYQEEFIKTHGAIVTRKKEKVEKRKIEEKAQNPTKTSTNKAKKRKVLDEEPGESEDEREESEEPEGEPEESEGEPEESEGESEGEPEEEPEGEPEGEPEESEGEPEEEPEGEPEESEEPKEPEREPEVEPQKVTEVEEPQKVLVRRKNRILSK